MLCKSVGSYGIQPEPKVDGPWSPERFYFLLQLTNHKIQGGKHIYLGSDGSQLEPIPLLKVRTMVRGRIGGQRVSMQGVVLFPLQLTNHKIQGR